MRSNKYSKYRRKNLKNIKGGSHVVMRPDSTSSEESNNIPNTNHKLIISQRSQRSHGNRRKTIPSSPSSKSTRRRSGTPSSKSTRRRSGTPSSKSTRSRTGTPTGKSKIIELILKKYKQLGKPPPTKATIDKHLRIRSRTIPPAGKSLGALERRKRATQTFR